jgi:4-diphosphocytidyl-2-C-methyl-D-erythritol kinase
LPLNEGAILALSLNRKNPFPRSAIRNVTDAIAAGTVAHTCPPAKLNLFLELIARRDDGFHEIDTVMVPIDWCDQLYVRRSERAGVRLNLTWLPSEQIIARRLGAKSAGDGGAPLMGVGEGDDNLVHRALTHFVETFEVGGGFDCKLEKSIPAGAGMGGASSDAAAALRCAAAHCGIPQDSSELAQIAAEIGSDVPFFLGLGKDSIAAARATGRGEVLESVLTKSPIYFVIVFPGVSLSTAKVYADSQVPLSPRRADRMIEALESGDSARWQSEMTNRLTEPAKKLATQIDEIIESLWQVGLRRCQLTGSGSACFAIADSFCEARRYASLARAMLEPGAVVMAAQSTRLPAIVEMTSNNNMVC